MGNADRFTGRVALVTGASSGIGAATARRLLAEGARVASLDLHADAPDGVLALAGDVSRSADVEAAVTLLAPSSARSTFSCALRAYRAHLSPRST